LAQRDRLGRVVAVPIGVVVALRCPRRLAAMHAAAPVRHGAVPTRLPGATGIGAATRAQVHRQVALHGLVPKFFSAAALRTPRKGRGSGGENYSNSSTTLRSTSASENIENRREPTPMRNLKPTSTKLLHEEFDRMCSTALFKSR